MTNEYGSDQPQEHEHEEHAATPEVPAHEGEPGVWTDDQPPHDDFGAANEDMATVSQEAATEAESEETAAAQTRQSRSMLPILAGLGGILLLGGVIYLQFGHSSSTAPPLHLVPSQPPSQQAGTSASQLPPAETPPSEAAPTTASQANSAEADINSLYKPAGTPTPVTMPASSTPIETTLAPIPTPPPATGATNPANAPTAEAASKTAAAAPTSSPLSPPTIAPQQGNPSNPVPPMPGQVFRTTPSGANAPTAGFSAGAGDAQQASRLNALSARIDTLQKSLDQVTNMVAAVPAATGHADTNVDNRLNRIEQTLLKIESDQAAKGTRGSSSPKQAVASSSSETAAEEPAPRVTHSTKHKHHTKSSSSSSHHHTASTATSSAGSSGSHSAWFLRAATPKEAWVSADPNSSDLRHVQIGESLPGIGVVRSIRPANGGWEIEGSTGIVR